MPVNETAEVVLSVDNIVTQFNTAEGTVHAVNGVSFDVHAGELLGVVGESGCGKSVTMMSLVKLVPMPPAKIVKGSAMLDSKDLIQMDLDELQRVRGAHIGFIFQDPMTSLNPVLTVGYQLTEALRCIRGCQKKQRGPGRSRFLNWSVYLWPKSGSTIFPTSSRAVCVSG